MALLLWLPDWFVFIMLIAVAIFTTSRNLQVTTAICVIFFVDVNSI